MNAPVAVSSPSGLGPAFDRVRQRSVALCEPLSAEDACAQSMPDASPAKWHLAHTTWFFEQFVLGSERGYEPVHAGWDYLFNSYYDSVGERHARPRRGMLTRPSLDQVLDYRRRVDARMHGLLARDFDPALVPVITLGLHHEQQHQELLLTDIKHLLSCNPMQPAYAELPAGDAGDAMPLEFVRGPEAEVGIGHVGAGFAYDNEGPAHRVLLHSHAMATRAVTNGEFREFIGDGGYRTPTLWLSEGWAAVQRQAWTRPLYWAEDLDRAFTLGGMRELDPQAPVCHVSFFEADAFARWADMRLPREDEWETLARAHPQARGSFQDDGLLQPQPARGDGPQQLYGDVWEWTASPYVSYPGYRPAAGALGEYNGKFMCGQMVLRGGSCVTPADHIRATYRNFFHPGDRWQFSGIRLARD